MRGLVGEGARARVDDVKCTTLPELHACIFPLFLGICAIYR